MSEVIDHGRRRLLGAAAMTAASARLGMLGSAMRQMTPTDIQRPFANDLLSLGSATAWLNSPPLTAAGLRGKVVLIDVWTYTCINWLRTLPYVRAWNEKYAAQGLTTIGVHTPEFDFERDVDNIVAQARALRVPYPIAVDSDYGVWNAFDNHYWPAVDIADA